MASQQASLFDFNPPEKTVELNSPVEKRQDKKDLKQDPLAADVPEKPVEQSIIVESSDYPGAAELEKLLPDEPALEFSQDHLADNDTARSPGNDKAEDVGTPEPESPEYRDFSGPQLPGNDEEVIEVDFTKVSPIVKPVVTGKSPVRKSTRGRMKLSDMDIAADLVEIPADEILFQKSYYSIGIVSEMFRVNVSLIRFWENEFDILKPKKNGKGDRYFRPEDVKNLQLIYHLLREKKYTIEGAKDFLKKNKKAEETFKVIESLKKMKLFLLELKNQL